MLLPEIAVRVWLYAPPTDMRKSFDGLSALVRQKLVEDPTSGQLFVFINRRRTQLKALYFERAQKSDPATQEALTLIGGLYRVEQQIQDEVIEGRENRTTAAGTCWNISPHLLSVVKDAGTTEPQQPADEKKNGSDSVEQ